MSVDLGSPLHFVEIDAFTESGETFFEQVRPCTRRHRGEFFDHFRSSYTYVFNGAHVDMKGDAIVRIHYVESFNYLRHCDPQHPLLPENKENN